MSDGYDWEIGVIAPSQAPAANVPEYRHIIEKGEISELEDLLMERLDADPSNIEYFIPGYRFLIKRKEHNRALALLQLHVDCLAARQDIAHEVRLLGSVLLFWPDCTLARDGLVGHCRVLYKDSPNFDALYVKLAIAESHGIEALALFEAWLRYDQGRIVYMPSKGAGRVKEVNVAIGVLRVAFESGSQMSFKIDEAQRLCLSLSKDHFLSVKLNDPGRLIALAESNSGELLSFLFSSVKRSLSLPELRDMLRGVVPDAGWAAWWTKVKKDARLTVGTGAKAQITWSDSSGAAALAIMERFDTAPALDKVALLHQHAGRSSDIAEKMAAGVAREANAALQSNPSLALELRLELESFSKTAAGAVTYSTADLLNRPDAAAIIAGVDDRITRKKAMTLVCDIRSDWPSVFAELLPTEADAQCLTLLYESLRTKGHDALCDKVVSQAIGDPAAMPRFYAWLCKEMPSRPELLVRADASFVLALLRVIDKKEFRGQSAALRKLFDLGEAADRAVTTLDAADASRVLDSLSKDNGLEDYRKDRIRDEIYHLHPQLRGNKVELMYVTSAKIEEKRLELKQLISVDIPRNSKEIQRTREYGDLRENFEYHAARARQEMLSSRAKSLHDELNRARTVESLVKDTSKVSIGACVRLRETEGEGEEIALTILGPWDSDPSKNILSYTSAAGAAMLGLKPGDAVRFNEKAYTIAQIDVWNG